MLVGSYFEESDFCWRVWLLGYKIKYIPKTFILHKVGFTSKKMSQININHHSLKNRICSFSKNLETKNIFFILFPHICIIMGLGFYYLIKTQFEKSKMVFGALAWNISNLKSTLNKRTKIQKMRIKNDDEIFKIIMRKTNIKDLFSHFQKVEANFK